MMLLLCAIQNLMYEWSFASDAHCGEQRWAPRHAMAVYVAKVSNITGPVDTESASKRIKARMTLGNYVTPFVRSEAGCHQILRQISF